MMKCVWSGLSGAPSAEADALYEELRAELSDARCNLDEAEAALMELAADPRVLTDPEPRFLVVSYGDSAINVRLRA